MTPAEVKRLQTRLGVSADGVMGRQTWAALFAKMGAPALTAKRLALGANVHCPRYEIDTPLRLAHFLGQTAHESAGYHHMREIWGPTEAQRRYEGRADLGNTEPGDGRRYLGRGPIQITGRANYRRYGCAIGIDLEESPELAEMPSVGLLVACLYWHDRSINMMADRDDLNAVTRAINGGTNGLVDRKRLTERAKTLLL